MRKIPLKERCFLKEDLTEAAHVDNEERPEDRSVETNLATIRSVVLKDRDTHDRVRPIPSMLFHNINLDMRRP